MTARPKEWWNVAVSDPFGNDRVQYIRLEESDDALDNDPIEVGTYGIKITFKNYNVFYPWHRVLSIRNGFGKSSESRATRK